MYTLVNNWEGEGARLYRTPSEIRRDMEKVKERICCIREMLSIHNLLVELIPLGASREPEEWIPEFERVIEQARETLETLHELHDELGELREELEEVKCLFHL